MLHSHTPLLSLAIAGLLVATAPSQQPTTPSSSAAAAGPLAPTALALQQDLIAIAKHVLPSVVTMRTFVRVEGEAVAAAAATAGGPSDDAAATGWVAAPGAEPDYPGFRFHRSGSGFFVSDDGGVLTGLAPLQVEGERLVDLIEIETVEGIRILAEVMGIEPTLQLAALRCAVFSSWEKPAMKPLHFGDSDKLEIGSMVLGFGDPLGPERFMGTGLLVAKPSRDCYQELMGATYMQASMLVPAGAYGGPMVDIEGKVVGILSPLEIEGVSRTISAGSAWALPSKIVANLYESIRQAGTTQSPWLGFSVMSRTEVATARGLPSFRAMTKPKVGIMIENLFQPSPAAAAGIQPDDWLIKFDDVAIPAPVEFQRQLYLAGVGRKVTLEFFRAGETFTKEIVIEKRPPEARPR